MTATETLTGARDIAEKNTPKHRWTSVSGYKTVAIIGVVAFVAACLSIALQAPGQVSMDTSVQLYEAFTGQSISFNPPFMSAFLHWLGDGAVATSLLVMINTVLMYASFALAAASIIEMRSMKGNVRLPGWRAVLAVLVVMNPIVFLYAGIVWKDVLFASLLISGSALTVAASAGSICRRYACAATAIVLFAAAAITRQQGVFMVPVLLAGVIAALWPSSKKQRIYLIAAVFGLFALTLTILERQVDATIKPPARVATSVGFRNLMVFDLAGMIAKSNRQADEYAFPITQEQLDAIRAVYTPERVDTLDRTPLTQAWVGRLPNGELRHAWWLMLKQNPGAYVSHRFAALAKLLGLNGLNGTLPIHIGVEGNPAYLSTVGMEIGRTQRSQLIFDIAKDYFSWPIYRHAFWLVALIVVVGIGVRARLPKRLHIIAALIATATALMYGSFLPTTIAADFRYLFGAIPLVMLLMLVLLLGTEKRQET
jgi:hypothetical protein